MTDKANDQIEEKFIIQLQFAAANTHKHTQKAL